MIISVFLAPHSQHVAQPEVAQYMFAEFEFSPLHRTEFALSGPSTGLTLVTHPHRVKVPHLRASASSPGCLGRRGTGSELTEAETLAGFHPYQTIFSVKFHCACFWVIQAGSFTQSHTSSQQPGRLRSIRTLELVYQSINNRQGNPLGSRALCTVCNSTYTGARLNQFHFHKHMKSLRVLTNC